MSYATALVSVADLARLHSLMVCSRLVVEGVQTGAHRSPHKGHSVDFADHRPYVAGDDLRHLDWKVLGRADRLVLKRYEAETDLACTLCVDGSASMAYQGTHAAVTKYRYACLLAAALAHLTLGQQDRAGLVLFHDRAAVDLPPRHQGQLERICHALQDHQPALGTDVGAGLERLSAPATRRGLVMVFSDFLDDPEQIVNTVARLTHRGHDCALVWILDPDEADLSIDAVTRFQGMESGDALTAEPRALRTAYLEEVQRQRLALQTLCRSRRLAFVECRTDEAPHLPLNRLLVNLQAERR
ncbi:hypothetical protein LBMAG53_34270 [Planctomycetota bacterium]|nr:hypothetical protein LBMAG53_34270 [Planctomycetota bacterium]